MASVPRTRTSRTNFAYMALRDMGSSLELVSPRLGGSVLTGIEGEGEGLVGPPGRAAEEHGQRPENEDEQDELRVHGVAGHGLLLGAREPPPRRLGVDRDRGGGGGPSWAPRARCRGTWPASRERGRAGRTSRTWRCGTWAPPWSS